MLDYSGNLQFACGQPRSCAQKEWTICTLASFERAVSPYPGTFSSGSRQECVATSWQKKQMDSSSAMTCTRISAIHKRATTTTSMSSMAQHGAGYVIGPDTSRELLVENITSSDHGGGSRLTTWFRRTQKTRRLTLLFRHDAKGAASTRKVLLDLYGTVTAGHSIGSSPSTCAHMAEMRTLAFASSPHPLETATLNCGQDGAPSLDVS